jgi:hypothetical protein
MWITVLAEAVFVFPFLFCFEARAAQPDRIEIIRGPGGTIWGANAVNGVINIITKEAKDSHGGLVSAGAGNVDQGIGQRTLWRGKFEILLSCLRHRVWTRPRAAYAKVTWSK